MAALKGIPIRDEEGNMLGQRFEASAKFKTLLAKNYDEQKTPDGRNVRLNRKLIRSGLYHEKGFDAPAKKGKE